MSSKQNPFTNKKATPLFWDWFSFRESSEELGKSVQENPLQEAGLRKIPVSTYQTRETEYEKLREKLGEETALQINPVPSRQNSFTYWYAIAAAVTLILAVSTIIWSLTKVEYTIISTQPGEVKQYVLPDSSVVHLNANTRLTFAKEWTSDQTRQVWLAGEAFFSVRKQPRPGGAVKFIVHTPDLDVQIVGTEFNVVQQPRGTQVVLQEGKIQLSLNNNKSEMIQMEPGQLIEYSYESHLLMQKSVNPHQYTAWKNKQLIFDNHTIQEVAAMIEEIYKIKVVIQDEDIAHLRLSGKINSNDVELVLKALQSTHNIQYEKKQNQIILYSKH